MASALGIGGATGPRSVRPWPEGARSMREGTIMPTVDLTAKLARASQPGPKDTRTSCSASSMRAASLATLGLS